MAIIGNSIVAVRPIDTELSSTSENAIANKTVNAAIASVRNEIGTPLVANTAAEMTDTNKIYVYVGSETGYTNGNWYYYDGSHWVSGGVYNSQGFETDKTLMISDAPADAKTVGDKFDETDQNIQDTKDEIEEDIGELSNAISDVEDRVDILEALEKGRGFTPEQLQTIAASGHADEYFQIGDIIYIDWTDNTPATPVTYHVPHVVTHFGDVEDENGVTHSNAMWLMWMYATPQTIQFDRPEAIIADEETFQDGYYYYTKNADNSFTEQTVTVGDPIPSGTTYYKHVRTGMAGRLRYGSNDWSQSAYRQWLNSAGGKGEWWTAQHDSDVAPDQATTVPGFLTGYSSDWLAIFKPIKVQTALNTVCDGGVTVATYDKFFLPSLEQMYGSPQASGVEGEYWEYWKNELGLDAPTNGSSSNTNDARKIPSITAPSGAAVSVRLRSATRSLTHNVWNVATAGFLTTYYGASYAYRAQPACVIY